MWSFSLSVLYFKVLPNLTILTLSQTTNFRLFQTGGVCRRQFQIWWKWQKALEMGRKHCGKKEKLLIMSNFSFSHSVFKRLLLQTRTNQGLFGKGLKAQCLGGGIRPCASSNSVRFHWQLSSYMCICAALPCCCCKSYVPSNLSLFRWSYLGPVNETPS